MNKEKLSKFDPLIMCLQAICNIEHIHFSDSKAKKGLPTDSILTPRLFSDAATNLGFISEFESLSLKKLSSGKCPKVLILENNNACVLLRINSKQVEIIIDQEQSRKVLSHQELSKIYTGYAITLTANPDFEERSKDFNSLEQKSWFWGAIWRYKSYYVHVILASLISNLFVLVPPIYIMNVYDRVVPNQAMSTLWMLTIGAFMFFLFDFAARVFKSYLIDAAGRKADNEISNHLYRHLVLLRMKNKPHSAGAFANYFNEFEIVRDFFTSASVTAIIDLPFIIFFLVVIHMIGGAIVFVPLAAIPLSIFITIMLELPARKAVQEALAGSVQKQALLVETISGMETIKTLNAHNFMQKRWEHTVSRQHLANNITRKYNNIALNITVFIQQLVTIGIIIAGVHLIVKNELSVGALVACSILSGRVMQISQIVNLSSRLIRTMTALQALNRIMELETEEDGKKRLLSRTNIKGNIEFIRADFSYPGQKIPAISKIHLKINAGEKVGIIGSSGSGKTTLLRLISGLYLAESGIIKIDNTDIKEIDPADIRSSILYTAGGSTLFYGTLRENILMANPELTDEAFTQICDITGVTDFASKNPSGYDMQVGERGEELSSGQTQMIMLARLFAHNSNVILLDEVTSALDNRRENEICNQLRTYLEDKTAIIVTHRMKLLDLVDRLIVFDNGKIIADGNKDEIIMKMQLPLEE